MKKDLHRAVLVAKREFVMSELPEMTAFLNTGASKEETINILQEQYKKIDIHKARWIILLLKQLPSKEEKVKVVGEINFLTNLNNKLACIYYTAIRLDTAKYEEGENYLITYGK